MSGAKVNSIHCFELQELRLPLAPNLPHSRKCSGVLHVKGSTHMRSRYCKQTKEHLYIEVQNSWDIQPNL